METLSDLIEAAMLRTLCPLFGYSVGEAWKAVGALRDGNWARASCCRVEPEWARRVQRAHSSRFALAAISDGQ